MAFYIKTLLKMSERAITCIPYSMATCLSRTESMDKLVLVINGVRQRSIHGPGGLRIQSA